MSLQVWLPLNGDLHNQGLNNATVTNNSATVDNNGKIGKCYSFNGTTSRLSLSSLTLSFPLSICAWVKFNNAIDTNTEYIFSYNTDSGGTSGHNIGFGLYGGKLSIWHGGKVNSYNINLSNNIWYHVTAVVTSSDYKLYLNGVEILSASYTHSDVSSKWITLGARSNSSTGGVGAALYFFNGYLNDARFYNHALSLKEVKEISKGLVLHYQLNQPNQNLIPQSIYKEDPWLSAIQAQEIYQEKLAYRLRNNTLYSKTGSGQNTIFPNITFKENTQYTLSVDWRDDYRTDNKNSSLYFRFQYSDGSTATQIISPSYTVKEWRHASMTSTSGKTVSKITTTYGNGGELYIANLKLEEGTLNTKFSYKENIIEDSSGYNNNGTIIGTLKAITANPKYNTATNFLTSSAINCGRGGMITDSITVNIWAKYSSYSNLTSCTEGGGWNFENNSGLTFPVYISGIGYIHIDASSRPAVSNYANTWHMFTGVYDRIGQQVKLYIDGILIGTGAVSSPNQIAYNNSNVIWLNAEATGSNTTGSYGNEKQIGDFRIYATALSAEDIKELYNTSKLIDSQGNKLAREVNSL